ARQLAPDKIQVHYLLSLVLYKRGDPLGHGKVVGPTHFHLQSCGAEGLTPAGAPTGPLLQRLSALAVMETDPFALAKTADPEKGKALLEEAVEAARKALAIRSDSGLAHMALGLSLKSLGRRSEALAAFRQAVHCSPEYAEMHLLLGEALAEEGKF